MANNENSACHFSIRYPTKLIIGQIRDVLLLVATENKTSLYLNHF